jgi:hypothetical protein
MSKITKTKETFGWLDGYLYAAGGDALMLSSTQQEWEDFITNYGSTTSLIAAMNAAWDNGGGTTNTFSGSVVADIENNVTLVNDLFTAVAGQYYGTNESGVKGFLPFPALFDGYDFQDSVDETAGVVKLVGDSGSPGATTYYGTNSSGDKGFYALPIGTATNLSDILMPVSGAVTALDTGDEWFNQTYSTSVTGGFDLISITADPGPDPIPLRYFLSIDAGDVTLRSSTNPTAALTTYRVAANTSVEAIGPIRYIYAVYDPELATPIIQSTATWDRAYDRTRALLFMLTVYSEDDTEYYYVTDMRSNHQDLTTKIDQSFKYGLGAITGRNGCVVSVNPALDLLGITSGSIQYGLKRYIVPATPGGAPIPYLWNNGTDISVTSSLTLLRNYDNVGVAPTAIPAGLWGNLWVYARLCAEDVGTMAEVGAASICVMYSTATYMTAREAKNEVVPLVPMLPGDGRQPDYAEMGNVVPIARITIHATGTGVEHAFVSQPMSIVYDTPPKPELRDIPETFQIYSAIDTITLTEYDRNKTIVAIKGANAFCDVILPAASSFGAGYWLRIISLGTYAGEVPPDTFTINRFSGDDLSWMGRTDANRLNTTQSYSTLVLTSDGVSAWLATELTGVWDDGYTTRVMDGFLPNGNEGSIVTLDAFGNISDSGVAIADLGSGTAEVVSRKTTTYPVVAGDANGTVFVCSSTTDFTVTMEASPAANRVLTVKSVNTGVITVSGNGHNIDGVASITLGLYESAKMLYEGAPTNVWHII